MSVTLPNGSTVAIAAAYGSALTVSAATNANPSVLTSTAHGLSNGDIIEVTSGWTRVNNRVYRVANVAANTFELEGHNASSTTTHPAGSGTGSVRKITSFTQISQILSSASSGGEQEFTEYQFLEADSKTRIPTSKAAAGIELEIADDPALAGMVILLAANDDRAQRAVKILLANSSPLYYNAYCSVDKTPSLSVNNVMAVKATLSLLNAPVRYTS